jgi:predicted GTPase
MILGITGSGKSSLGCSLSNNPSKFEVGHQGNSHTKIAEEKNAKYGNNNYIILDTPGTLDLEGDFQN